MSEGFERRPGPSPAAATACALVAVLGFGAALGVTIAGSVVAAGVAMRRRGER